MARIYDKDGRRTVRKLNSDRMMSSHSSPSSEEEQEFLYAYRQTRDPAVPGREGAARPGRSPVPEVQEDVPLSEEEKMVLRHQMLLERRRRAAAQSAQAAAEAARPQVHSAPAARRQVRRPARQPARRQPEDRSRSSRRPAADSRKGKPRRVIKKRFFFIVALFLALVLVAVFTIHGYLSAGYTVTYGKLEERKTYSGVVLRSETITRVDTVGSIVPYAQESKEIKTGDLVMDIYGKGYSSRVVSELESTQARIRDLLNQNNISDLVDTQMNGINESIDTLQQDVIRNAGEGQMHLLQANYEQLEQKIKEKQVYLGSSILSQQNSELRALVETHNRLLTTIDGWKTTYMAQKDGILCYSFDGYEPYLNVPNLETLSVDNVRSVMKKEKPTSTDTQVNLYRIVDPGEWYLLLDVKDSEWRLGVGESCDVFFTGFGNVPYQATVNRINRKNTDLLVVLKMGTPIGDLVNTRVASVQIGTYSEGMMVPVSSLMTDGTNDGVYLQGTDLFIPVSIICRDGDYALVLPLESGKLEQGMKIRK